MRLDYVKSHPTTARKGAVVALAAEFTLELTRTLDPAELELSVLKNSLPTRAPGVSHLQDYADANQLMLNAFEAVFPADAIVDGEPDLTDRAVSDLLADAWALADILLAAAFKEA